MERVDEVLGTVVAITVFPVRSAAGRSVAGCDIASGGVAGDRIWQVVGPDGAAVRGRHAPRLAEVAASGDPDADAAAVRAALGEGYRLAPADDAGVAPVHLVSRGAVERASRGDVPEGCSPDDPRANLLLDTEDDERRWVGRTLVVGSAVLTVTRTPKHCLGVYAEVRVPGRIEIGDSVRPST